MFSSMLIYCITQNTASIRRHDCPKSNPQYLVLQFNGVSLLLELCTCLKCIPDLDLTLSNNVPAKFDLNNTFFTCDLQDRVCDAHSIISI